MPSRELVVLGTASQAPTRTRNHNGYLLRWDADGLLFDPGEGTQRQMLLAGVTASQVTCICVTHFHGDHCLGLPGVLARMALDRVPHVTDLCFPAQSQDVLARLRREGRVQAGGRLVALAEMSEPRPGQRAAFIMDTRLCDNAFALAQDADLLICESTFADSEAALARDYGHLTARQAGQIAAQARARLLVLTHFSQRYDHDPPGVQRLADEAGEAFGGPVVLARDLERISVPARPPG